MSIVANRVRPIGYGHDKRREGSVPICEPFEKSEAMALSYNSRRQN